MSAKRPRETSPKTAEPLDPSWAKRIAADKNRLEGALEKLQYDGGKDIRREVSKLLDHESPKYVRRHFLDIGGIKIISKLLDDPDTFNLAIGLVGDLDRDFTQKDWPCMDALFSKMAKLLHVDDVEILVEVCRTLAMVAYQGLLKIHSFSFAEQLVKLGTHSNYLVRKFALDIIVSTFQSHLPTSIDQLVRAGAFTVVRNCLQHPGHEHLQDNACKVLQSDGMPLQAAIDAGVVLAWVELTKKVSRVGTAGALNKMVPRATPDQAFVMFEQGCLEALWKYLRCSVISVWSHPEPHPTETIVSTLENFLIKLNLIMPSLEPTLYSLLKYDGVEKLKRLCGSDIGRVSERSKRILADCYTPGLLSQAPRVIITLCMNEMENEVIASKMNGVDLRVPSLRFGGCTYKDVTFKELRRFLAEYFKCSPGFVVFATTDGVLLSRTWNWLMESVVTVWQWTYRENR